MAAAKGKQEDTKEQRALQEVTCVCTCSSSCLALFPSLPVKVMRLPREVSTVPAHMLQLYIYRIILIK